MVDTVNVSWKTISIVVIIILLFFGTIIFFGTRSDNQEAVKSNLYSSSQDIPEKCKVPSGEDINSWKEHLSHHAELQECLNYFK